MILPSDPLDLAVLLYKKLEDVRVDRSRDIEGTVPPGFDYSDVVRELARFELLTSEDRDSRKVEFSAPRYFFASLSMLLDAPSRRAAVPSPRFYVADLDYCYPESGVQPELIRNYFLAVDLFQSFRKLADHEQVLGEAVTLVFLHNRKLEITSDYTTGDLRDISEFQRFQKEFFSATAHAQQKAAVIKSVLVDLFEGEVRIPFAEVLRRFNAIVSNSESNYELYVSEFSFQKVKAQIEQEKFELTAKLNKVFSDIQNQLLAIPAALVLVGGQMERTGAWSVKNLFIWLGALVFSKLMDLLISNQQHTLDAIKREIDQQWELLQGQHRGVALRFRESYNSLNKRYKHQVNLLRTVSAVVGLAFLLSTAMLVWYSMA